MTRDELMQIGHDAGFDTSELTGEVIALLECVAEHAEAKERAARIEAQQRLADMQELAAKAGLSHMKTVQEAVAEAVAAEREACALVCESICWSAEIDAWIAMTKKEISSMSAHQCASAIRARGTP